jgi:recombination protein RecT
MVGSAEKYNAYKNAVQKVIPAGVETGRYWQMYVMMMQQFYKDPKITNKESILSCLFNAPKLGLIPDPVMGQIYFIPYKGVLTYQIGYKGMITLSIRSGLVSNVRTGRVFERDNWKYYEDEIGQHYYFEPALQLKQSERGKEIFCYSVFEGMDHKPRVHVIESEHVDKIKKMCIARTPSGPWANDLYEPEMRKKTALRRHWKTEPMSVEIAQVIEHEESVEHGEIKKDVHVELENIVSGLADNKGDDKTQEPILTPEQQAFSDKLI